MPAHAFGVSAAVPGAPTIGTLTAGDSQVTVRFTPPSSDGGSPITGYTATTSPGGFTGTGTSSPIVITGLSDATSYTATVVATSAAGDSAPSAASNADTTDSSTTVPGAPTIGTATRGNGQVTVSFSAPASNGGKAIDSYQVISTPGSITKSGSGSPLVVTGLTNGTGYTFKVRAHNTNGYGSYSGNSSSVTPATVPSAPIIGTATQTGPTSANVTFSAPSSDGGSALTTYTATSTPGGKTHAQGALAPKTIAVSGLTPGTAYTFKVTATNAIGTGPSSAASNSITTPLPTATVSAGNINVSVATSPPGTTGSPSGTSTATVTGGVGPFTYAWAFISGGAGITLTNTSTATVRAGVTSPGWQSRTGTLRVTVTDTGNGGATCTTTCSVSLVAETNA